MHNSYMYVIANDGVDTSSSYRFKGKVGSSTEVTTVLLRSAVLYKGQRACGSEK